MPSDEKPYDIIAISAGFDRHEGDWGGLLKTEVVFHHREMG